MLQTKTSPQAAPDWLTAMFSIVIRSSASNLLEYHANVAFKVVGLFLKEKMKQRKLE